MYYRGKGVWYFSKQLHQGDSCWRPTRLPQHTCMVSAQYTKSPTPRLCLPLPLMTFVCQATCIHSYGHFELVGTWSHWSTDHWCFEFLWHGCSTQYVYVCQWKRRDSLFWTCLGHNLFLGCPPSDVDTRNAKLGLWSICPVLKSPFFNCVDRQRHHFQRVWWCSVRLRTIS